VLGLGLAILRDILDTSIRSAEALRSISQVPVLGVISSDGSTKKPPLLVDRSPRSPRAEAFRQIRTNLQFVNVDSPLRVLVVTSSSAQEGKSTTAANLALTIAETGRRVLLIEGDLRRPKVAEYLGLEGSVGLTNVLAGQVDVKDVLQPWGHGNMTVLPSGSIPANPSELLGSHSMKRLLDSLKKSFDIIIIDTPPLLPVTDAAVTAVFADGAVVIVGPVADEVAEDGVVHDGAGQEHAEGRPVAVEGQRGDGDEEREMRLGQPIGQGDEATARDGQAGGDEDRGQPARAQPRGTHHARQDQGDGQQPGRVGSVAREP